MSYDLYLFRPRPGVDAKATLEQLRSADGGLVLRKMLAAKDPNERAAARQTAGASVAPELNPRELSEHLRTKSPELALSPGSKVPHLTHRALGLQLSFEPTHVAVSVPYSHRAEQAPAVFRELSRYLSALEREGGLETYDPQLGRVVQLPRDLDEVVTVYARGADTVMNPTLPEKKPWWRFW